METSKLPEKTLAPVDGGAAASEQEARSGAPGGETAPAVSDSGSDAGSKEQSESPERRKARYRALVTGEFKDLFAADTQRVIDRRFKETRVLRETLEAQEPVLERLKARYGAADCQALAAALDAEEAARRTAAEEQEQLRREQQARWEREAEETQGAYPQFDWEAESSDPAFLALLEGGVPVRLAYEALHLDLVKADAARAAEKRLADHIRALGSRPQENGASAQNAVAVRPDVSRLTRQQRSEIARKAMKGERITFR